MLRQLRPKAKHWRLRSACAALRSAAEQSTAQRSAAQRPAAHRRLQMRLLSGHDAAQPEVAHLAEEGKGESEGE